MLRVQLYNEREGVLLLNETDPGGLSNFGITLKRSDEYDGLFHEFSLQIDFNNEGRDFIRKVFETDGPDGIVTVNVYEYSTNDDTWNLYYSGQLRMLDYQLDEVNAKANIEQTGAERKFLNLLKTDLDIETLISQNGVTALPSTPTVNLPYHAKTILKQSHVFPDKDIFDNEPWSSLTEYFIGDRITYLGAAWDSRTDNNLNNVPPTPPNIENVDWAYVWNEKTTDVFTIEVPGSTGGLARDVNIIGQISTEDGEIKELIQTFELPFGFSENPIPTNFIKFEEAGNYDIDLSIHLRHYIEAILQSGDGDVDVLECGASELGIVDIEAFIEHRNENDVEIFKTSLGNWTIPACGNNRLFTDFEQKTYQALGVNADVGDKLYVYYNVRVLGTYKRNVGGTSYIDHNMGVEAILEDTFINVSQSTVFPASNHKSILIYEWLDKICQFYMDQQVAFRSNYFGRTDTNPTYPEDGPGSMLALTNGRNLRNLENKTIFTNFDDTFRSIDSIHCLGWGFETLEDGTKIIRIEPKDYFYNKDLKLLDLGFVSGLKKKPRSQLYKLRVDIGYQKIEKIAQTNAVDEFNTRRKYVSPILNAKGSKDNKSIYRASGYEIESERRLSQSTEESRLDDSNFLVVVRREGIGFRTDQAEDFEIVTGIFDPSTSYNLKISPTRNMIRWGKVFSGSLLRRIDKKWRFSFGELNYEMSSKLFTDNVTIFENGDIDYTNIEALYYNEDYEFEAELRRHEFQIIQANPRGYVVFKDWKGNKCEGYIVEVADNRNTNKAKFKLRRVFRV